MAVSACVTAARAQPDILSATPAKDWLVTLGGTLELGPAYDGANLGRPGFMPTISWRRVGEPEGFSAPDDGLELPLISGNAFAAGAVAAFRPGRYRNDDHDLTGLRKIPWSAEAGVYAEAWPVPDLLRLRLEIRQGMHGHHGVVADAGADVVRRFGLFQFSLGPRLELADGAFMRTNFGVSPAEASANGRVTAFRARGGLKSAGVLVAVGFPLADRWSTTLFARYDRLIGDAGRSPIVAHLGQRDQFSIGAQLSYSFTVGL